MVAKKSSASPRPLLQWGIAAVGAAVTASAIGVIIWDGLQPASPPSLSARILKVEATSSGHVAVIEVVNDGDDTAAGVDIEAVLGDQSATATLDYVPGHGQAKAYVRFDADPRTAEVRVKGWSAP